MLVYCGMRERFVEPEILDGLAHDEPQAMRSRRDLRRIHFLMGNESWMLRMLSRHQARTRAGIWEWGAGDGALPARVAARFPDAEIHAADLVPRPPGLDPRVHWHEGDLLVHGGMSGGVLIANMFLHHFNEATLARLGEMCGGFELLVFNEPHRSRAALLASTLLLPFVGPVTRHDMPVSIRAGFRPGELPALLGLRPEQWRVEETYTWRGALRVVACRC